MQTKENNIKEKVIYTRIYLFKYSKINRLNLK